MSNIRQSRNVDKRIHYAYQKWDGRPMDIVEISRAANVNVTTIKRTLQTAMQKLREAAPPHLDEYLQD